MLRSGSVVSRPKIGARGVEEGVCVRRTAGREGTPRTTTARVPRAVRRCPALSSSLVGTAKLCGLDPGFYLRQALTAAVRTAGTVNLPF